EVAYGLVVGPREAVAGGADPDAVRGALGPQVVVERIVDPGLVRLELADRLVVAVAEIVAVAGQTEIESEGLIRAGGAQVGGPVEAVLGPCALVQPTGVPRVVARGGWLGPFGENGELLLQCDRGGWCGRHH